MAPSSNPLFEVVYDHGPVPSRQWETFDVVRDRVAKEWSQAPKQHDPISEALRDRIENVNAIQAQNRTRV